MLSLLAASLNGCDGSECETGLPTLSASSNNLQVILQITFGTLAAVAVLVILASVIRYMTALGDPQKAAQFRKSIIYSAVGLVIAISAEIIVTFVLNRI